MKYQKLFSRGKIGQVTLPNRIVMPPMGTNMAGYNGEVTDEIIAYYAARAKGGCGLIISEIARVDEQTGIGMTGQISAAAAHYVPGLLRMSDAVHQYGSRIFLQLHHPGREASKGLLRGVQPVAPSPIPCKVTREMPRELTAEECEALIRKFVTAAYFAKAANFDGVELHAAHGYLLNQFLSPYSNHRTDQYGGSEENRLRFVADIVEGIRKVCGPAFAISVRLSCDEYVEGGLKIQDTVRIASALEAHGVDAISVSAGIYESGYAIMEPQGFPEGWKKHLATEIKKNVSIPVVAVNNIKYPATAERFLEEGVCDFVAVGRGQLADSAWAAKAREGRDEDIRKCLGCLYCFTSYARLHPIECTVNPLLGRERRYNEDTLKHTGEGRSVAVIGGGPAGMHAAALCARRGYRVSLFEKAGELGGALLLGCKPPHKELLGELLKTQKKELRDAGVDVRLGTEAETEVLRELDPWAVIVATGGQLIIPSLPGIDRAHVCTAERVLAGDVVLEDKNVVVIGGGVTGLETAEVLSKNNKVTVVEMGKDVGTTLYITVKMMLLRRLSEARVTLLTNHRLSEVGEKAIRLVDAVSGESKELAADAVVLAVGVRADNAVYSGLHDQFDRVFCVGDADKPGQIADAMRSANDIAYVL